VQLNVTLVSMNTQQKTEFAKVVQCLLEIAKNAYLTKCAQSVRLNMLSIHKRPAQFARLSSQTATNATMAIPALSAKVGSNYQTESACKREATIPKLFGLLWDQ